MPMVHKAAIGALLLSAVACGDRPAANQVSREAEPLVSSIADARIAFTFAQTRDAAGRVVTLLVTGFDHDLVRAVDLTASGAPLDADVFDVMSKLGAARLAEAYRAKGQKSYRMDRLLPAGGTSIRHVATGTNFREHAKEAGIGNIFNFPKFNSATPPRTSVALRPGALLDYEVEICVRFDRNVSSVADFDAARKGFFLCGDFTDRAKLMRLVDPKHIESGRGFSDAKSGDDFFPTGPFLVIPGDWKSFVDGQRMTTEVNRVVRQDARGVEMIVDFRGIVGKALTNGEGGSYRYRGSPVPLLAGGRIARGSAVMSGTSEGVIFMPPRARDFLTGGARYIFTGPMLRGESAQRVMIEGFIDMERAAGRYLKAGDMVSHRSSTLGDVQIRVTEPGETFVPPPEKPANRIN
ncbi:fumarylacetoacetate hydrolase family protein [uncultured Sphingomonas sp.]|uniref:fumarylacetoacetate hydrolase family protein n=1 Tax=uncultured Sphingomonas sp. TaxID=158754 RepID=UPI0035C9CC4B